MGKLVFAQQVLKIANGEEAFFHLIGALVCRFEIIVQRYRSWALPEENPKSLALFGFSSGDAPKLAARPTLHAGDVVRNLLPLPRRKFGSGALLGRGRGTALG